MPIQVEEDNYANWICKFVDEWPTEGREYRLVNVTLPDSNPNDDSGEYKFTHADQEDGVVELSLDETKSISYTVLEDLYINIKWNDYSVPADIRPVVGENQSDLDWLNQHLILYCNGQQIPWPSNATVNSDTTSVVVNDLPAVDDKGNALQYYIGHNVYFQLPDSKYGQYVHQVQNTGNYSSETEYVYTGGTLVNTIKDSIDFIFNKVWYDSAKDPSERPEVTFRIYRFAVDTEGADYSNFAPVKGRDFMIYDPSGHSTPVGEAQELVYKVGQLSALDRYDEYGHEYVYYLTEHMSNAGDYVSYVVGNPEGIPDSAQQYVHNGATLVNALKNDLKISAPKTFHAAAVQGMTGAVEFGVQRRAAGSNDAWEPVTVSSGDEALDLTKTVGGFTAEKMTQTVTFEGLEKYDKDGNAYEFRIYEKAVTVNGHTAQVPSREDVENKNDTYQVGEYTFRVIYNDDGSIENRLVGETEIRSRKNWDPNMPADGVGTVKMVVTRTSDNPLKPGRETFTVTSDYIDKEMQDPTAGYVVACCR